MKIKITSLTIILNIFMLCSLLAQTLPLVYDVENTGAKFPKPPLPTIEYLPIIESLPDPFEWSDGRGRISSLSDWAYRRAEIGEEIQNYEIGLKPSRPDTITASYSNGTLTVTVTVGGRTLTLTSAVSLPTGTGPFPALIGMNSSSGNIPSTIFTNRNIAQITFSLNQVTTYGSPKNTDPYYRLYPSLNIDNTGQYSAWAWGVSRIIDGLELVKDVLPIDIKHLAVTGCSYAGKLALFAGAFDERIALTIAQESGGGGYTTWRYSQEINKTVGVETLSKTDHNWFKESMWQFGSAVSKLPEDHHELMAMVAPRALLVTGNPDYVWLADESGHVGSNAAKEVWKALGIADRFGYSIVSGHLHCAVPNSQLPEIEAFVEKFLLGNTNANTNIATTPFKTNLAPWIKWTTPQLSNKASFLAQTSLIYPANQQKDLPKSFTLKWNKVKDAAKYLIQYSLDGSFATITKSDSTTTDTVKTVSDLIDGKKYYWRVQVKNGEGIKGPWSSVWNFSTFISLPVTPGSINTAPYPSRSGYMVFRWKKSKDAEIYFIQISTLQMFTTIFKSDSTADTTKILNGLGEGQRFYWRVQAKNVSGLSSWSEIAVFTSTISAPTNFVLQRTNTFEVTLTWDDNSTYQDGYIIERKKSPQTTFTVIDTFKATGAKYVDTKVEANQTYTYRTKAYTKYGESEYSNEATLTLAGIHEDGIPTEYSISQNYPNPFNPTTKLRIALPNRAVTKLVIYDLLGREVETLINGLIEAGYHEINFNAANIPSGVYFYKIQSGDFVQSKKMILMK